MSKEYYIISLLNNAEVESGLISQSLYDFLVESVMGYFEIRASQAKQAVTRTLRELYVTKA